MRPRGIDAAEWATCIHESGHVVIGARVGIVPSCVSLGALDGDPDTAGCAYRADDPGANAGDLAVWLLAGRAAQTVGGLAGGATWTSDYSGAKRALQASMRVGTPHWKLRQALQASEARALVLAREEWGRIFGFAHVLVRQRVMGHAEIRRVLARL